MLDKKFQELAANPTLAEASLAELVLSLEGQFQTDMKRESDEFLATLKSANAKIRYLHANKDLTPEQANEREVIMLFRRIQHENLGSVGLGGSAPQEQPTAPAGAKKDGAAKTVDKGAVKSDNKPAPTATPDSGTRKPSPGETKKDAKTGAKDTEKPKDGTKSGEKPKDE